MKTGNGYPKLTRLMTKGHAALLLLLPALPGCGGIFSASLEITTSQGVHPVLIRNQHNPLLRLTVEAESAGHTAGLFNFNLNGTDDPNDIESLELFYSGDQEKFEAKNRFGVPVRPTGSFVFTGNQELSPGKNRRGRMFSGSPSGCARPQTWDTKSMPFAIPSTPLPGR